VKESAGAIRLTTALYYTPSGVSIQAKGIDPDVTVEPAKIEKVAVSPQQHEADLRGALKNDQAAAQQAAGAASAPGASPAATPSPTKVEPANPPPNVPPGTTPVTNPGANALDSSTIGTDSDYQFVRAIDLLRGVTLFNRLAAQ
jgi:carboxyl-terminal processing protease